MEYFKMVALRAYAITSSLSIKHKKTPAQISLSRGQLLLYYCMDYRRGVISPFLCNMFNDMN